jgi:hypothetical protein
MSPRLGSCCSILLVLAACSLRSGPAPAAHGTAYINGRWFDGTRFVEKTIYVADGTFRTRPPAQIDSTIDLGGGYVVPPFGDAHQHLTVPAIAPVVAAYLRDGIFYVKDQSNAPLGRRPIDPVLNRPTSIDYISSNQGWTSPGGHPVEVIKRGAMMGEPMASFIRDSLDPGLVMQVDTKADIDKRWPYFLAGRPAPDFVKVFLFWSENYSRLRADPKAEGNRGIDPALVPYLVTLAHQAGLHVSAHVYTAADFRAAIDAGVDQIAHLPGGRQNNPAPFLLSDADAASAAAHRVVVITTITQHGDSAVTDKLIRDQYAHNIAVLRAHNVPLLVGSDVFGGTAAGEAAALARSRAFSNLELLRMWSVATPQAIFPKRRIGVLDDGYEASFLVLRADPLTDFTNTRAIVRRVKQGITLH